MSEFLPKKHKLQIHTSNVNDQQTLYIKNSKDAKYRGETIEAPKRSPPEDFTVQPHLLVCLVGTSWW